MTTELPSSAATSAACPRARRRAAGRAVARAAARRRPRPQAVGQRPRPLPHPRALSAATVRGTIWTVVDRCDGTLTRVTRGIVVVENLRTGRTKVVRAGEKWFVPRAGVRRRR